MAFGGVGLPQSAPTQVSQTLCGPCGNLVASVRCVSLPLWKLSRRAPVR